MKINLKNVAVGFTAVCLIGYGASVAYLAMASKRDEIEQKGYAQGHKEGYALGEDIGYIDGYSDGYADGKAEKPFKLVPKIKK